MTNENENPGGGEPDENEKAELCENITQVLVELNRQRRHSECQLTNQAAIAMDHMRATSTAPVHGSTCKVSSKGDCKCVHAERRLLYHDGGQGVAKYKRLLLVYPPCRNCAEYISFSEVKEVWYLEKTGDTKGIEFLEKKGILCKLAE